MPEQPVDYERPTTVDERLEAFELWVDDRRVPEGAPVVYVLIAGAAVVLILGAVYLARAVQ